MCTINLITFRKKVFKIRAFLSFNYIFLIIFLGKILTLLIALKISIRLPIYGVKKEAILDQRCFVRVSLIIFNTYFAISCYLTVNVFRLKKYKT